MISSRSPFALNSLLAVAACSLALLLPRAAASTGDTVCRDEDGNAVDWFVILKYPDGFEYAYTDANTKSRGLRKSSFTLDDPSHGALAQTLVQGLYDPEDPRTVGYYMYNDEFPTGQKHGTRAHAKGIIAFGTGDQAWAANSFWLIHSVPRFPTSPDAGSYGGMPVEERTYGQSMLCVSVDMTETVDQIAAQLLIARPWAYGTYLPPSAQQNQYTLPRMVDLVDESWDAAADDVQSVSMKTAGGKHIESFYKNADWGQYLYEDVVEPKYGCGFMWETWMNGINPDPSFCPTNQGGDYDYASLNVREVSVGADAWKETQDHSKWGVSLDGGRNVVCIGDINRQQSQNRRGGGTTCIEDEHLRTAFASIVTNRDQCDGRERAAAAGLLRGAAPARGVARYR